MNDDASFAYFASANDGVGHHSNRKSGSTRADRRSALLRIRKRRPSRGSSTATWPTLHDETRHVHRIVEAVEVADGPDLMLRSRKRMSRKARGILAFRHRSRRPYLELSYTTLPPTIVNATFCSLISLAGMLNRSAESTTMSASLPAAITPLLFSWNSA